MRATEITEETEMSETATLENAGQHRLVKLIQKAPKDMPTPPRWTEKRGRCDRCGGSGGWAGWPGYTCYRCGGSGLDPKYIDYHVCLDEASPEWIAWATAVIEKRDASNAKRRATLDAKKAAEREAREAEAAQKLTEAADANPTLKAAIAAAEDIAKVDAFAAGVLESVSKYGEMSDKQEAILKRALDRVAEKAADEASKSPVIEGRIEVTGKVITTKWQESHFGYNGTSVLKMLVRDDRGFKVWGTVPSSMDPERGDRVKFTATVEKSNDDECFGFFKRPTKAEVVEKVAQEA